MSAPARGLSPTQAGVIRILAGSFLISFSAVFVKITHTGPTATGLYRNVFGALALLAILCARRDTLWRGWRQLAFAVLAGGFFAADIWFWHRSILYIGPGLATIMGNFQVFVLATVGVLVFKEKATWRFVVSIPLALAGLFMLLGGDWMSLGSEYKIGVAFGILTALTYAGYLLTLRRAQRAHNPLSAGATLTVVTAITALFLLALSFADGEDLRIPDRQSWLVLITYGVTCQALGWIIITRALRMVDASRAGLLLLTQPTLTFIWDIVMFDRPTSGLEAFGAALALAAIYLGNTRRGKAGAG